MSISPNRQPRPDAGFSLIEIVAALTILVLIAGTLVAIVSGSTQAAAEIGALQREDRRTEAFVRLFRETMSMLPPEATLELRIVESSPLVQELVLHGDPDAFAFGPPEWNRAAECRLGLQRPREEVALEWRRRRPDEGPAAGPGGTGFKDLFALALNRPDFYAPPPEDADVPARSPVGRPGGTPALGPDGDGQFWLPLIPDLEEVSWRFWDAQKQRWLEQSGPARPPMIELTLRHRGRATPLRAVFRPGA